uniref:Homeobox domain-containing protein n=1 Tax=Araucaria cunninghamii TaxID=56994 RepID=A0A0D6QZY6_ARACU
MSFGLGSFLEAATPASGGRNDSNKRFFSEISSSDKNNLLGVSMAQSCLAVPSPRPNMNMNIYNSTPKLSLTLTSSLEAKGDMFRSSGGESQHGKNKDDEYESRSGSDNMEGNGSGDDQDDNQPRKKRYHRHTPQQIQEMEALFKECPHPDEKQRQLLSKQLGLAPRQIKFWFQNRRTQMKAQHERHENSHLRQENEKLRMENLAIREAMRNPICTNCGGPAVIAEMSLEEQQLRIENVRLKEELERVVAIAGKFYGRPIASLTSLPLMHNNSLDLAVGAGGGATSSFDGLHSTINPTTEFLQGPSYVGDVASRAGGLMAIDRSLVAELAIIAMDELVKMARMQEPLWIRGVEDKETLNYEEYLRQFPRGIGPKPLSHKTEATRQVGTVMMDSLNLVETLMDANRCKEMFPCMLSRAATVEVISSGAGATRHGALQLMFMEMQVLSPLVPTREVQFLRFCQQQCEGVWAVVDVSVDSLRENTSVSLMTCRRRPSGCLIHEMNNGFSQVTWVEHSEYDDTDVHSLYRSVVNCGIGFGAGRWLATLQRQSERLAVLMATNIPSRDPSVIPSPAGRRSMLKLAQRMTNNFCAGVSASSAQPWTKLSNGDDDIRVTTRKSDDPGEPSGVVLSAATSVWLPVSPQRLFEFLRDASLRSKWDILSNGGPMQEMAHIAKGHDPGNSVSLLGSSAMNSNQTTMLILQECCTDSSGSLVVYAPVDVSAMHLVMNGGDSTYVSLLPSGFAILPEGPQCRPLAVSESGKSLNSLQIGGSLLTVAFQIWVSSLPTAKLTMESVETVNNLITRTVKKIKAALGVENDYD